MTDPKATTRPAEATITTAPVMVRALDEDIAPPVATVPAPDPRVATPKTAMTTEAEQVWSEIKDRPMELFGLPAQTVAAHCTPVAVEPSHLYLDYKNIGAVVPALETCIGNKYYVELMDRFVVVSVRKPGLQK
jgi:hypothetical protein